MAAVALTSRLRVTTPVNAVGPEEFQERLGQHVPARGQARIQAIAAWVVTKHDPNGSGRTATTAPIARRPSVLEQGSRCRP